MIKKFNFYKKLFENSKNQSIDFNVLLMTGVLGNFLLTSTGFRISSLIFMAINCISLLLLLNFNFEVFKNSYSFLSVLYICICWFLLFIGVGASAILPQQILIDKYRKYKQYYI